MVELPETPDNQFGGIMYFAVCNGLSKEIDRGSHLRKVEGRHLGGENKIRLCAFQRGYKSLVLWKDPGGGVL